MRTSLIVFDLVFDVLPMHDPGEECKTLESVAPSLGIFVKEI